MKISYSERLENNTVIHILIILLLSFLVYSNTLNHQYGFDDNYVISALKRTDFTFGGVFKTYFAEGEYRPISLLSFLIEKKIFYDFDPYISHTFNVLLWCSVCILSYFLISKLPTSNSKYIAILSVLLFISLPVHSEVVSNLKNRDNLLSMIFTLLCLLTLINLYKGIVKLTPEIVKNLSLIIAFFLLAILSKLDSVSVIPIGILTVIFFYKKDYKLLISIVILFFTLLIFREILFKNFSNYSEPISSVSFTENPIIANQSFLNKLSQSIQTIYMYLIMMVNPNENLFYYGYNTLPLGKGLFTIEILLKFIVIILFLFLGITFYKKNKLVLYGYLFFLSALIYCANFITPVAGIVANRYAFIASLGFCIFFVSLSNELILYVLEKQKNQNLFKHKNTILLCFTLFVSFVYSTYTYSRNKDWYDMYTLIKADLPRAKDSFQANRIALSNTLYPAINIEDITKRNTLIKEALQYGLNAQNLFQDDAYVNEKVALAYFKLGNPQAAKSSLLYNIQLKDKSAYSWELLGDIYFESEKKIDSAAYSYSNAIKLLPENETAYFKYLNSGYRTEKKEETYQFFKEMDDSNLNGWIPSQCLAYYYLLEKDSLKGMQYFLKSYEKGYENPGVAEYVKGELIRLGDTEGSEKMNQFIQ